MMNRAMLFLAVAGLICACAANEPEPRVQSLPQPPRVTSAWQFVFEGKDYWRAQNERYLVNHGVELSGEDGLAYVVYSFGGFAPISDLDTLVIDLEEIQAPQNGAYFVGLADFNSDGWRWFETEPDGFELTLGGGDNFVSESGILHLAIVLDSTSVGSVNGFELIGNTQPEWIEDSVHAIPGVVEPSGICLGPGGTSMFIVDDGSSEVPSGIAEVDFAYNLISRVDLGSDLEGICYCPVDGLLYVADEAFELIYLVEPTTLAVTDSFYYSRSFDGEEVISPGGDGIEAITFIPDASVEGGGYFLLLNQNDPTVLLRIDRGDINSNPPGNPAPLAGFTMVEQRSAGGLYFNVPKRQLWVVHSWLDFVEVYNIDTMKLVSRDNFPGFAQEGVTLGPEGELWVCNDTGFMGRYTFRVE